MKDVFGNDAIKQIAGKRIREVYFQQTQGGENQLVIVFTDFSGFSLHFGQADTKFLFEKEINFIHKTLREESFQTICSDIFDPDGVEKERVKKLFHALWSKSGNDKYDKEEWMALGAILDEAGY